jgi:hypothetical protein
MLFLSRFLNSKATCVFLCAVCSSVNESHFQGEEHGDSKSYVNVSPRTGVKAQRGIEVGYSSTLSSTSALDVVDGQPHAPAALPPVKKPGTHFIGGRVGPRTGVDACGKSRPHRDFVFSRTL